MATFIGDYTCKVDAKGRITFPSAFKKQMTSSEGDHFVVKKDIFEKCLVLYPMEEWNRQNRLIREKINPYDKEHNRFLRNFYRGTAEVSLDGNSRLLIPKRLLDTVEISKEVIMAGQDGKIEIWARHLYEKMQESEDDFANLAQKIMGNSGEENGE
ncbi:MAG: division/cell wall cluster transcriptional repressor MraZ [Bacteroidales bacterium]|nr:division/cell wall cluster transcriptional repressor MraZ [Bacteroidales bacterium]MBS3774372.1 division/cell wall cluster transcriptional repressor MraZ [Bacteroidales bacterium]